MDVIYPPVCVQSDLLSEGGVAGHMNHLYDNLGLKFSQMKDIFQKASNGELVGTEKTDGQNIFLSYSISEQRGKAARNKSNIKKGGLSAEELASKFAGRGALEEAFNQAFEAWEAAIQTLPEETQLVVFGPDTNIWYNAEIQDPGTANVINYDDKNLVIHQSGHAEYDRQTGKAKPTDVSKAVALLSTAIENAELANNPKGFRVVKNAVTQLRALGDDKALSVTLARLEKELDKAGISDTQTVGDYVAVRLGKYIEKNIPSLPPESKDALIKKILGIKGLRINDIVYNLPKEEAQKVKLMANNASGIMKQIIAPVESIVHDFTVAMLKGLQSAFVLDNDKEVGRLAKEVGQAINIIQNSSETEAIQILNQQLKKLKNADQVSTAVEGFVFDYEGVTYKFTGNFAPVNQILGLFRFGRGKIPPLKHLVKESEKNKIIALVPGGYKPPHMGHYKQAEYFANIESIDIVEVIISPKSRVSSDGSVEVTAEQSKKVWDIYAKGNPKIVATIASTASPVKAVFDFIETQTNPGDTVFLGASEKEAQETSSRFKNIGAFIKKNKLGIRAKIMTTPTISMGDRPISATDLRNMLATDAKEEFFNYLPQHLSVQDKEAVWSIMAPMKKEVVFEEKIQEEESEYTLEEIAAMAAGAVAGTPAGPSKKRKKSVFTEEMFIDRQKLLEELTLRRDIRSSIHEVYNQKAVKKAQDVVFLRDEIRKQILNEKNGAEETPHASTGINVLEELLKKIIPILETGYKTLTTNQEQRKSYRAHILNAVQKLLAQADITARAGGDPTDDIAALTEQIIDLAGGLEEIDIEVGEPEKDEKFIDIDGKTGQDDGEVDTFSIEGEDETGRNMAQMSFEKIENQILDSYGVLSAEEDKKLFYDYLLANLKLYFDKFESELDTVVDEPTAGDEEASQAGDELGGAEEPMGGEEEGGEDLLQL